jgi:hypothetical protein
MTDWFTENDLLGFLPRHIVDRILQGTYHHDFSGNPVVSADELDDRIAMALRDINIRTQTHGHSDGLR